MATLTIGDQKITVDDSFLSMSPADQNAAVEEIAGSLQLAPPLSTLSAPAAPAQPEGSGVYMNATAGLNDAIYNVAGAPVDAMTHMLNLGIRGMNTAAATGIKTIEKPFGGSDFLADLFGKAGVAKPEDVVAASPEERIARGAGEGVGYTVGPQAAVGGLKAAGAKVPSLIEMLSGAGSTTGQTAATAFAGGTAGAGAATAAEIAPDEWKPTAGLIGALAGGGLGALATGVPAMAREGARQMSRYADPLTVAGQQREAGRILRDAATDPVAAREALENPTQFVPGSQPTTFQASGDMGLGALERSAQTRDPVPFQQRRADQNSARLGALGEIQPGGHPEAVSKAFRAQLAAIDEAGENAIRTATEAAQGQRQALGGNQAPDAYGDALRGSLADARAAAKARENALWKAVDPENRLDVPTANVTQAAQRIMAEMPTTAAPMAGDEAAIFNVARGLPGQHRLSEASALRSRISDAMRAEKDANGQSAAWARLAQLRGAVQDDLEGVIARRAADDERAVASRAMREADSLGALLKGWADSWYGARSESAGMGQVAGGGARAYAPSGSGGVPTARGTTSAFGGQLRGAEGNSGLQAPAGRGADAPGLHFDDAARERLRTATAATKDRAQTFDRGAMGPLLARPMESGPYNLGSSSVPGRIFHPGAASADRIASYRQAVGDGEAMTTLQDYAASQLIRSASRPDGTLDPAKVATWRKSHADALRAFPDLDARFADAARASEAVAEATAARRASTEAFQKGAVGRIMGLEDPADVTRTIGGLFSRGDAAATMQQLAKATASSPEAREGLRKSVADYMANRFISSIEAGTSGEGAMKAAMFSDFVKTNAPALRHVFSADELKTMQSIAADLQRANRSLYSVKIPAGSNTAQDTFAIRDKDTRSTIFAKMLGTAAAGGAAGFTVGGPIGGLAGAVGVPAAQALRQYGVQRVDELVRDALLDPALARTLLYAPDEKTTAAYGQMLVDRYKRAALAGGASAASDDR